MSDPEYEKYWPQRDYGDKIFSLDTVCGAMENTGQLFLLGVFGGFGGCLHEVHRDLDKAKESARKFNEQNKGMHLSVYRMSFELIDEMIP